MLEGKGTVVLKKLKKKKKNGDVGSIKQAGRIKAHDDKH